MNKLVEKLDALLRQIQELRAIVAETRELTRPTRERTHRVTTDPITGERYAEIGGTRYPVRIVEALSPDEVREMVNAEPNPLAAENVRRGVEMVRALPRVPSEDPQ